MNNTNKNCRDDLHKAARMLVIVNETDVQHVKRMTSDSAGLDRLLDDVLKRQNYEEQDTGMDVGERWDGLE